MIELVVILISMCFFLSKSIMLSLLSGSIILVFCISFEEFLLSSFFYCDGFSKLMVILSLWLLFSILIFLKDFLKTFLINFVILISMCFFLSKSIMPLFIFFELSVFPILILILGWGVQPERLQAGFYMFLYTLICGSPLLMMVSICLSLSEENILWSISFLENPFELFSSGFLFFFFLLGFLSKIPIFLTHVWLPKAHVEATLEGSMILAGVLLKLGVFGVVRILPLFIFFPNFPLSVIFSISLLGLVYSAFMSMSSDDMKMTVAFASVSHMNVLTLSLFSQKLIGQKGAIITSFSHGMSSSLLFFSIYSIYFISHSRSILLNKGLSGVFPILILIFFVSWTLNLSVPPSIGFLGELFSILAPFTFLPEVSILLILYFMISSFYSMFSFGTITHSQISFSMKGSANFMKDMLGSFFLSIPLFFFFFNFS